MSSKQGPLRRHLITTGKGKRVPQPRELFFRAQRCPPSGTASRGRGRRYTNSCVYPAKKQAPGGGGSLVPEANKQVLAVLLVLNILVVLYKVYNC